MTLREAVLAHIEQPAPALAEIATPAEVVAEQALLGRSQSIWTPLADACENAVLVACTRDPEYATIAAGQLQVDDFDLAWRREVWVVIVDLLARGKRPSLLVIGWRVSVRTYDQLVDAIIHAPNAYTYDYLGTVKAGGDYRRLLGLAGERIAEEGAA